MKIDPTWRHLLLCAAGGILAFVFYLSLSPRGVSAASGFLYDWQSLIGIPIAIAIGVYSLRSSAQDTKRHIDHNEAMMNFERAERKREEFGRKRYEAELAIENCLLAKTAMKRIKSVCERFLNNADFPIPTSAKFFVSDLQSSRGLSVLRMVAPSLPDNTGQILLMFAEDFSPLIRNENNLQEKPHEAMSATRGILQTNIPMVLSQLENNIKQLRKRESYFHDKMAEQEREIEYWQKQRSLLRGEKPV